MSNDDYDLTPDQWEALKALRGPMSCNRRATSAVLGELVRLGLAAMCDGLPEITAAGRKVLVRGSCRLLDVAA